MSFFWLRVWLAMIALGGMAGLPQERPFPEKRTPSAVTAIAYVDVAASSGLVHENVYGGRSRKDYILETTGNGAAILDFNRDGANDILLTNGTTLEKAGAQEAQAILLYKNDGSGRFSEVAAASGLTATGWGQSVCVGDYDNDGDPDVLVTFFGHNRLYNNQGDGSFSETTAESKLPTTETRWGAGCSFVDYDRDGWLDLFVANYVDLDLSKTPKPGQNSNCFWKGLPVMCGPRGLPLARNALYRNQRNGTFADVSEASGILKAGGRYGLGVVATDFDNDGWLDIYVACDQTPSLLYRNRGNGTFEERGIPAGVAYNFDGHAQAGMGVAVADYDGNGFFDIVKTNFSGDLPSLYNNEDGKFFSDLSKAAGLAANQLLGWGVSFIDADEDGWKDILMANGHVYPEVEKAAVGDHYLQRTLLYRNLGNGRFADITADSGPALKILRPARGLAHGDLDNDGHPEVVIVNMNEKPSLLKNEGPRQNAVVVALGGVQSNRSAIGARVVVEAERQRQMDEVRSGGSFYSHNDFQLYFGVGKAARLDRLEVRWPTGKVQEWKGLPINQRFRIREGSSEIQKDPLQGRTVGPEAKETSGPQRREERKD
jgi:hypothetical protein